MEVLKLCVVAGVQAFNLGAPILEEELEGKSGRSAASMAMAKREMHVAGANIYVNCIAPGGIRTVDFDGYLAKMDPEQRNQFYMVVPAGRLGEPREYCALAVHLASDETYCVGQIISPNGGVVL